MLIKLLMLSIVIVFLWIFTTLTIMSTPIPQLPALPDLIAIGFFIGQLGGSQLFWAKHMFCGNHAGSPSIHGTIQRKSVGQRLHPFDLVTRHSKSQSSPRQTRSARRFRQSPCRGDLNEWQTTYIDTLWMPFTYIIILSFRFRYLWDTL